MKTILEGIILTMISTVIALIALEGISLGYSTQTHRRINNVICDNSVMDEYFSQELLRPLDGKGRIADRYNGISAYQLFEDAGEAEDSSVGLRYRNHFHDPLKIWKDAGYLLGIIGGTSNLLWAQDRFVDGYPEENSWTWQRAYAYFLGGLTAQNAATRDQNMGNLFSTLGRLTHLAADMSVPEHTRNDSHALSGIYRTYETWCKDQLSSLDKKIDGVPVFRNGFPPENAIYAESLGAAPSGRILSPVSNLWDSRVEAGYNQKLYSNPSVVGLADYSNFNYFSGDAVFKTYGYPAKSETGLTLREVPAKDGKTDYALYFNRTASDGVFVKYLASADLLYSELANKDPADVYKKAKLAPYCWEDYASNLVPRAVSYGTSLVNYFFRGKFGVASQGSMVPPKVHFRIRDGYS